ncbi:iron reductase domain protein [Canariomyces notabilis]|uniref:Iron reductase domain protein n=1 Tax=Canariomyces notabilis TaxID=2074819 RepID=A0AAN6TK72_9PEZI|nr:iron reductase domain protein [Canariomyces arenarius]
MGFGGRWLHLLSLGIIVQLQLARAQTASTFFIPDTNTIVAVNLPEGSDDVNFYVATPDWYQYTAIGFGRSMADALMLVMYPSADGKGVTVSPRLSTGNTEPVFSGGIRITLHEGSGISNSDLIANGTCHSCRVLGAGRPSVEATGASPMMFAVGPSIVLNSDDLDARIRRHVAYGRFTADLVRATGPGGVGDPLNTAASATTVLAGDSSGSMVRDSNRAATAHGVLYIIATLAVAPVDTLIAGACRRWSWLHAFTGTMYFLFVVGAMVPGILISREHVVTQQFRTGHQVLGLLTFVIMACMFFWGIGLSLIKRTAKKRGQEPPESTPLLAAIHRWVGRLIWVLLLISNGLGLRLSEQPTLVMLGYAALAGGVVVFLVPVYFFVWRCFKRQKQKDEAIHELQAIYR